VAAASAVARRAFADGRTRTLSFAIILCLAAVANVVGYRHTYPTDAARLEFAKTFGSNRAVELFYGVPHDLLTVGGYAAWRVGGFGSIIAAAFGVFAAVRALRADEDAGRWELVLAGTIGRRGAYVAALAAVAGEIAALGVALFAGLVVSGLPAGGSAYLTLATVAPAFVFAGVGALTSQLGPSRRIALELGMAVFGAAFLLRVVADIAAGLTWLRWATPLGWSESLRPFAQPSPAPLLLFAGVTAALVAGAGALFVRRDIGSGLLAGRDSSPPRLRLLGSPAALAFREERGSLLAWAAGIGAFAVIVGVLSTSFTNASVPESLRKEIGKIGASITTPAGALGLYFSFFVLAISLFGCAQVASARREEDDGRLETLFAQPFGRTRWLAGRLLLAGAGATVLALLAGVLAWAGAAAEHAGVSLSRLLEAGANCLPASMLFLGVAALAFAAIPRASSASAYTFVGVAFVWALFGSLLGAPSWLIGLSPFQHVALVPAQPFRGVPAAVMVALALVCAWAALAVFRRRDLTGA